MSGNKPKTLSLVLGSGGARGMAHIGVIRYLEEQGYQIKSISGCSIGALIGGIYAVGKLNEYETWVRAITKRDIFSLLDFSMQKGGLFKGDRIIETLREMVGDTLIESLPISYTAVATNLDAGREVWINKGPMFDAIRASISIPLLFTPFKFNGLNLIDGGVLNPVPIAPTFSDMTKLTVAVNVSGPIDPKQTPAIKDHSESKTDRRIERAIELLGEPLPQLHETITSFVDSLKTKASSYLSADPGMIDVLYQSFDAMQSSIARQKLAAYPPDVTIEIPRNASKVLEFDRADELIALGFETARRVMARRG